MKPVSDESCNIPGELMERFEEMSETMAGIAIPCEGDEEFRKLYGEAILDGIKAAAPILMAHARAEAFEEAAHHIQYTEGHDYVRLFRDLAQAEREKARKG